MKNKLINLLATFNYPVYLQGSVSGAYPDSFFTFWNNTSDDGSHYDNNPIYYVWDFDVNFYSNDPTLVNTVQLQAMELLKQNGFIVNGRGYDVASDEPTHTGRGFVALIIDKGD